MKKFLIIIIIFLITGAAAYAGYGFIFREPAHKSAISLFNKLPA